MLAYPYVHLTRDASKPTRNGSFILMEFLIATLLSCESAEDIISRMAPSTENRAELVQQVKMSTEEGCFEDAKAD